MLQVAHLEVAGACQQGVEARGVTARRGGAPDLPRRHNGVLADQPHQAQLGVLKLH